MPEILCGVLCEGYTIKAVEKPQEMEEGTTGSENKLPNVANLENWIGLIQAVHAFRENNGSTVKWCFGSH